MPASLFNRPSSMRITHLHACGESWGSLARSLDNKHSSVFTRHSEISLCGGDSKQAKTASGSVHLPDTTTGKRKFRLP